MPDDGWMVEALRRSVWMSPRAFLPVVGVFLLGCVLRVGVVVLSSGGLRGTFGYDASVYYAAADSFVHGRMPYGDFVLLHPPAGMLALAPFAAFGALTTDHTGFVAANLTYSALGAVNAVLVWAITMRANCGRAAALLAGALYAVWFGAIDAEFVARLEPLGNFAFLCGLLLLVGSDSPSNRRAALAGGAVAVAVSVKLWWGVPLLVLIAWQCRPATPGRRPLAFLVGALSALVIVNGAFFFTAPSSMWRMVVTEQLGRQADTPVTDRLTSLTTIRSGFPDLHGTGELLILIAIGGLTVAIAAAAWRSRWGPIIVALVVAQILVIVIAPSYETYYADFLAPALALMVGFSAARFGRLARLGRPASVGLVLAAATLTATTLSRQVNYSTPFPGRVLAHAVRHDKCVISDSPMALIELDSLSRGMTNGCQNWVDVTGYTFGIPGLHGNHDDRPTNATWQGALQRYLLSGDAVVLVRAYRTGISRSTMKLITGYPVLRGIDGFVVYRISH